MTNQNINTTSKFKIKAYFIPFIIILFTSFPIIVNTLIINKKDGQIEKLILTSILPLVVIIVSIYQLKNNLLNIIVSEESITFRRYLGYGKPNTIKFYDIDRYKVQMKVTKGEQYEILKIIKDNKTLLHVSQFYINNYNELKLKIEQKIDLETNIKGIEKN